MEYVKMTDDMVIIRLGDRINYKTGAVILNEMKPIMEQRIKRIDVYCGELEHISSVGIKALIHIKKETRADMVLHDVNKLVRNVFAICLADGYFVFENGC